MDIEYGNKLKYVYCILNEYKNEVSSLTNNLKDQFYSNDIEDLEYQLNDAINSVSELKLFSVTLDQLTGVRTKSLLQLKRLKEENKWLKEELQEVEDKSAKLDEELIYRGNEALKKNFIYQIKSKEFNIEGKIECTSNNYEMGQTEPDIEKDDNENIVNEISGSSLKNLLEIIKEYSQRGQFDLAISICKENIESMNSNQDGDKATLLCMLGFLYKDSMKWEDASDCIKSALNIREALYGQDSSIVASTLNNLAIIEAGNNKFMEAEKLCRRALQIRLNLYNSNHESVAKQMNNLGLLLINMGSFKDGESFFMKALNIYEKLENTELFYLKTSTNLANLYMKKCEIVKAKNHLLENLNTIHKYRFKKSIQNILDLYISDIQDDPPKVLISDRYIVPEIVNLKFLIKLMFNNNQIKESDKLKISLKRVLPILNEEDEFDLTIN